MAISSCSLPLVCAYLSAVLIVQTTAHHGPPHLDGACLQDGRHKATPTPEPHLQECKMYTENSCCSEKHIEDLVTPLSSNSPPWDKCGTLNPVCESFLKRVACFYRCSPDAALWPHPQRHSSLHAVPLCHSFCRDWYEACRMEMTCARNWATDPRGQNCSGSCVPYQQMYQHGRDLCESLWGEAFLTVEDEEQEGRGQGRPCGCLTLSPSDHQVLAALRAQGVEPEELDTTKSGLPQYRAPCSPRTHPRSTATPQGAARGNGIARANGVLRKRSVVADDGEGSGSGM